MPRSAKEANKPNKRATELKPRTCAHQALADSGGGGSGGGGAPPFEIPKRVFKRDPPKTFAPAALAVAAASPPPFPQILDPPLIRGQCLGPTSVCFVESSIFTALVYRPTGVSLDGGPRPPSPPPPIWVGLRPCIVCHFYSM